MSNPVYGFFKNNVYRNFLAKLNPTPDYDVTVTLSNTSVHHTDTVTCTINSNLWANQRIYMDVTGGGLSDTVFTDNNSRTSGIVDSEGNVTLSKTIDVYSNVSISNFGVATITLRTGDADIGDIVFSNTITTRNGTLSQQVTGSDTKAYNNKQGYNYTIYGVVDQFTDGVGTYKPGALARQSGVPVDYLIVGAGHGRNGLIPGGGAQVNQGTQLMSGGGATYNFTIGSAGVIGSTQGNSSTSTFGVTSLGGNVNTTSKSGVSSSILTPVETSYVFGAGSDGTPYESFYTLKNLENNPAYPNQTNNGNGVENSAGRNGVVMLKAPHYENYFQ